MKKNYDYANSAEKYNCVEDIPGEKEMLRQGSEFLEGYLEENGNKISVLDFCCGTELIFDFFGKDIKNSIGKFVGVDINAKYLSNARERIGTDNRFTFVQHDAVNYKNSERFDVIIASSAYHHIEDERKVIFLNNIVEHLKDNGVAIFMENIIPSYANETERAVAAVEFYSKRIVDCIENHGIRDERIPLLSRILQYERDREYEMKSHYKLFMEHLQEAGLEIVKKEKVWPVNKLFQDEKVGDFVFVIKKRLE